MPRYTRSRKLPTSVFSRPSPTLLPHTHSNRAPRDSSPHGNDLTSDEQVLVRRVRQEFRGWLDTCEPEGIPLDDKSAAEAASQLGKSVVFEHVKGSRPASQHFQKMLQVCADKLSPHCLKATLEAWTIFRYQKSQLGTIWPPLLDAPYSAGAGTEEGATLGGMDLPFDSWLEEAFSEDGTFKVDEETGAEFTDKDTTVGKRGSLVVSETLLAAAVPEEGVKAMTRSIGTSTEDLV